MEPTEEEAAVREVNAGLQRDVSAMVAMKANHAAKCKAKKEADHVRRCELKGKAICVEDSKACRSAHQTTSIVQFLTIELEKCN